MSSNIFITKLNLITSSDRTKNGWTLVIRGDNHEDFDTLDRALMLIQGRVNVRQALLLQNDCSDSSTAAIATATTTTTDSQFPRSRVKVIKRLQLIKS